MLPSDANIHGNVHGGIILNLIEEAGAILTTRYCNQAVCKKTQVFPITNHATALGSFLTFSFDNISIR